MFTRDSRARPRCRRWSSAATGRPVSTSTRSGASSLEGRPSSARRARSASTSGSVRHHPAATPPRPRREPRAAGRPDRCPPAPPCGGSRPKLVELVVRLVPEGADEARPGGHPGVDLVGGEVVVDATATWSTPSTALTASNASATIMNTKLGAQKYVGSRRCTSTDPSSTRHDATNPRVVTGSSSSGSRTVSSASHTRAERSGTVWTLMRTASSRTPAPRRRARPAPRHPRSGAPPAPRCRRAWRR